MADEEIAIIWNEDGDGDGDDDKAYSGLLEED